MGPQQVRSVWKLWVGLTLFLVFAALGTGVSILSIRDRKWAALEARVDELFKQLDAPPLERLPLGRSLLPGNAWDDYAAAAAVPASLQAAPIIESKIMRWLRGESEGNGAEVASLLSGFEPRIDRLRIGTWRDHAKLPPPTLTRDGIQDAFLSYYGRELTLLGVGKARRLAELGNVPEALRILVDVCLFGRDLAGSRLSAGVSEGIHVMNTAFMEMRDILQRRDLAREDLEFLARVLELLDDHFPGTANDLRGDMVMLGVLLQCEDLDDTDYLAVSGRTRRNWRTFFSTRLEAAVAFFEAESLANRAIALESHPWSVAGPGGQSLLKEQSKNPVLDAALRNLLGDQRAREIRGNLRLLRVATRYRASGEVLQLDDPVGGKIRARPSGGGILVWKRSLFGIADDEPKENSLDYDWVQTIEVRRPQ